MFLLCAVIIFTAVWALMNWAIGAILISYPIARIIVTLVANIVLGLYGGKIIGRRLLYKHLKKVYKNKDLTDDQCEI